jgi:transposase
MVDYKKILQLHALGVPQRGIADALGCARNTVMTVLASAKRHGITYSAIAGKEPAEVRAMLLPESAKAGSVHTPPDFEWVHRELAHPNTTLALLWAEYATLTQQAGGTPLAYSSFTEHYRNWSRITGATMRQNHKPGERVEVDWAGDTMVFTDPATGAEKKAYLFVAALPYSAYFYVEAFADMKLASWLDAHVHAFEFFGGSGKFLIPDNLKTGVTKADRYEPVLNPAYAQLGEHYGTIILPARVRTPRDKSMAENVVRFGANQIIAILRHRRFFSLDELNEAIFEQVERLNAKPFQKRPGSRREVFLTDEQEYLVPLPPARFELAELRTAKVAPSYHIQVDRNFYSVPARYIGKRLNVRLTTTMVEIFDANGERITSHARLRGVTNRYQTVTDHMPPAHRAQLKDWTPARFTNWAAEIGPNTLAVIEAILASKKIVEQTYRSCLGVMAYARKEGGHTRLEQTCAKALTLSPNPSFALIKRLWPLWEPQETEPKSIGDAGFVRGAEYYAPKDGE